MKKLICLLCLLLLVCGCEQKEEDVEPQSNTQTEEKEPTTPTEEKPKEEIDYSQYKKLKCTLGKNMTSYGYRINGKYEAYYDNNNIVHFVEATETVSSSDKDILDQFETTIKQTYEIADTKYGGYTYNISRASTSIVATVRIDYSKMDLKNYVADIPELSKYTKDNKMTVDGIKTLYQSMDATCK